MKVYNLTSGEVTYKGRRVPPNGGSLEFPTLSFIPNRDLALQDAKILSFGKLPKWWHMEQALKAVPAPLVAATVTKPGMPNKNGDVFSDKKIVITTAEHVDSPSDLSRELSGSMSTERKKK